MDIKKIGLGVAGVLGLVAVGFVAAVSMQPAALDIDRSITIQATPAELWPLASDFAHHNSWDPWKPRDPEQTEEMSDPSAGLGAWYTWTGPTNGSGKMTITELVDQQKVVMDLDFIEPFESSSVVTMTLAPVDGGTEVHWKLYGTNSFSDKIGYLFVDIDAMLAKDFDEGLALLKTVGEQAAADAATAAAAVPPSECDAGDPQTWTACDGASVTLAATVATDVMNHPMPPPSFPAEPGEEPPPEKVTSYVDVGDVQIVVQSAAAPECDGEMELTGVITLVDLGGEEGTPDSYRGLRMDAAEVKCL